MLKDVFERVYKVVAVHDFAATDFFSTETVNRKLNQYKFHSHGNMNLFSAIKSSERNLKLN